jgi:arylsulfatase A-like enzyme
LFFLHTYQVHNPYNPEMELADEFYEPGFEQYRFDSLRYIKYGRELYKEAPDEEKETIEKIYDAACFTFDHRFGEFISFLKEAGIYDDSMIVVVSDHGEEFMDHGAWEHGHSLYNELINIPLIVKFPGGGDAGRKIHDVVSIVDILPTLLDFYGVRSGNQEGCDGVSLLDVLRGKGDPERRVISYLAPRALRNGIPAKISLISGRHKYVFNQKMSDEDLARFVIQPPDLRDELFDLALDPEEKSNIIDSHPEVAVSFMQFIRGLEFRSGQKGFLEGLKERLKSLGYF